MEGSDTEELDLDLQQSVAIQSDSGGQLTVLLADADGYGGGVIVDSGM